MARIEPTPVAADLSTSTPDTVNERQGRKADPQFYNPHPYGLQSSSPLSELIYNPALLSSFGNPAAAANLQARQFLNRVTITFTQTSCVISTTTVSSYVPCSFAGNQAQCAQLIGK